ncbi:hypothetical protein trd_1472 [Thermomicrobium roseum DSM 5159]|uniref:Uncharacterized protein n=1 Tax=Thermomicrobium roseum (strain ATCC 27502 / DSM 5159 / P-2) TaxID=309801 RepID=B9KZK2_THERP|nr:hypothetical protein trd_1472 [Thermomicrobium roseum DSM 5159]
MCGLDPSFPALLRSVGAVLVAEKSERRPVSCCDPGSSLLRW